MKGGRGERRGERERELKLLRMNPNTNTMTQKRGQKEEENKPIFFIIGIFEVVVWDVLEVVG
jgi:hypothetical protein